MSDYVDAPLGIGESAPDGTGRFVRAVLRPTVVVAAGTDLTIADAIHDRCFIARSVNFPVEIAATLPDRLDYRGA